MAQRELIVASRRPGKYWVRLFAPGLGMAALFLVLSVVERLPPAQQGSFIFHTVALVLFASSLLAGLFFTADAISSERREGTLRLLELTGLRELDLVVGKCLGGGLAAILGSLAAAPLLVLPLLLGGVAAAEMALVLITLGNTLLFSLVAGIFASSESGSNRPAVRETFELLLGILLVGVAWLIFLTSKKNMLGRERWPIRLERPEERWVLVFGLLLLWMFRLPTGSPALLLLDATTGGNNLFGLSGFWLGQLLLLGMTAFFLRRIEPFSGAAEEKLVPEPLVQQKPLPRPPNPVVWHLYPAVTEIYSLVGWAWIGAIFLFGYSLSVLAGGGDGAQFFAAAGFLLTLLIHFVCARKTAEFFIRSRESGLLETVLVTPLSWRELVGAQHQAILRLAFWPLAWLALGEVAGQIYGFASTWDEVPFGWTLSLPVLTILGFVAAFQALFYTALLLALRLKSPVHAAFWSVLLVLGVPIIFNLFVQNLGSGNWVIERYLRPLLIAGIYLLWNTKIWILARLNLTRRRAHPA